MIKVPKFHAGPAKLLALHTNQQGFAAIAQRAWHECGHTHVRVWVDPLTREITSNLKAGLPPAA